MFDIILRTINKIISNKNGEKFDEKNEHYKSQSITQTKYISINIEKVNEIIKIAEINEQYDIV